MSLAVSEFAMPCTVLDVERVKTLGETDKQRIALGAPLIIGDRCYRFNWDRQYAAPRLQCLSNQRSTPRRNRREEKVLTDSLAGQLRLGLVSAVDLDRLHPYHTVGRNAALEHVAAGGLLQARGRACSRRFTVVVDRHGKAAWTTVSESRWPALKALWNWLRCLGRQGRREWRDERQLLQELRCLLPADQVKARRESIEAGRSNLMRGLDRQNPADVQDNFRGRIATPEGVMQFLRYDEKALERFDNDARTVLHHVACDPRLATGPVLDSLFMKIAIEALECRGAGVANARPGAAEGGETTPRIFASDYDGNTPVHLAVLHGDKASVLRFLRQAAKTDSDNAGGAGPRFAERRNRAGQTIWDCAQARVKARRADAWVLDIVREHGGEPPAIQDSAMELEPARGMPGCSRSRLTSLPTSPAGRHGRH
ncbi:hypothetical protein [Cupriavidus sp. UGS-1]|uniref:hypothetical protein n=1 Tax=Cupriavidus sp. UGS-1 TaxID=2899826 RepID=UPI001E4431C2|nr:hypothetical protein [Cupriavidus sp. UGS-1]MCD9123136.1 hypothetical protein [Cupriavidus sp. UGS-1]